MRHPLGYLLGFAPSEMVEKMEIYKYSFIFYAK